MKRAVTLPWNAAEWKRQEDERVETRRQARERYGMYIVFSDGTYG